MGNVTRQEETLVESLNSLIDLRFEKVGACFRVVLLAVCPRACFSEVILLQRRAATQRLFLNLVGDVKNPH